MWRPPDGLRRQLMDSIRYWMGPGKALYDDDNIIYLKYRGNDYILRIEQRFPRKRR